MDGWLARWTDGSMNCGLINWWNSVGTGEEEDFRASNAQGIFFAFLNCLNSQLISSVLYPYPGPLMVDSLACGDTKLPPCL